MFICFHRQKLSSDKKGQLVPIFIVVLVVIIIMALVTVNLNKIAFFKTESGNAVDAAALAVGSAMATLFNAIAQSNSAMETQYWTFLASASVTFTIAFLLLATAISQSCTSPCSALSTLRNFERTVASITAAITAYWIGTHYFYCSIRKMADDSRNNAIKLGHRFSFLNSNIGAKLKRGQPPENTDELQGNANNYSETFSDFLDESLGDNSRYTYAWLDGEERDHSVISQIQIDPVRTYNLHAALAPYPLELIILLQIRGIALATIGHLVSICACWRFCLRCCNHSCFYAGCPCCIYYLINCPLAAVDMATMYLPLAEALAGIMPAYTVSSSSCGDDLPFIVTWIDDIDHNRLVQADSWQNHRGVNLAIWETQYPEVHSYGVVNFKGYGKIHPPKLRHDASFVATDQIGQ